jgi:hypothetical protein
MSFVRPFDPPLLPFRSPFASPLFPFVSLGRIVLGQWRSLSTEKRTGPRLCSSPATDAQTIDNLQGVDSLAIAIGSCAANEFFRGQYTSKLGWNSRVCGRIRIIGYIGINKTDLDAAMPFAFHRLLICKLSLASMR